MGWPFSLNVKGGHWDPFLVRLGWSTVADTKIFTRVVLPECFHLLRLSWFLFVSSIDNIEGQTTIMSLPVSALKKVHTLCCLADEGRGTTQDFIRHWTVENSKTNMWSNYRPLVAFAHHRQYFKIYFALHGEDTCMCALGLILAEICVQAFYAHYKLYMAADVPLCWLTHVWKKINKAELNMGSRILLFAHQTEAVFDKQKVFQVSESNFIILSNKLLH